MALASDSFIGGIQGTGGRNDGGAGPLSKAARAGGQETMEFQLLVTQQASSLAKLKIFHTMAKQVNDQQ